MKLDISLAVERLGCGHGSTVEWDIRFNLANCFKEMRWKVRWCLGGYRDGVISKNMDPIEDRVKLAMLEEGVSSSFYFLGKF